MDFKLHQVILTDFRVFKGFLGISRVYRYLYYNKLKSLSLKTKFMALHKPHPDHKMTLVYFASN